MLAGLLLSCAFAARASRMAVLSMPWRNSADLSPTAPRHRCRNSLSGITARPVAVPYVPRRAVSASPTSAPARRRFRRQEHSTTPSVSPCVTGFPKAPVPPRRQRYRCIRGRDGESVAPVSKAGKRQCASHCYCGAEQLICPPLAGCGLCRTRGRQLRPGVLCILEWLHRHE
jgi:hypothetical protein